MEFNSKYCSECGDVMVWRCTNNVTQMSKWKCKSCGHVQMEKQKPIRRLRKQPKHYGYCGSSYQVRKRINGTQYYLASFKSEALAKKFVALMRASEWDLSRVVEFKEACKS